MKTLKINFSPILAFLSKKIYFAIFGKKSLFFADFEARFSDFISKTVLQQLQQCREQPNLSLLQLMAFLKAALTPTATATGTVSQFVSVAVAVTVTVTATGTNFAASNLVAVAVCAKKDI